MFPQDSYKEDESAVRMHCRGGEIRKSMEASVYGSDLNRFIVATLTSLTDRWFYFKQNP